jgi:hypothetical protein
VTAPATPSQAGTARSWRRGRLPGGRSTAPTEAFATPPS